MDCSYSSKMKCFIFTAVLLLMSGPVLSQQLYKRPHGEQIRWFSFENPTGGKGMAAISNKGAKGHAFDRIQTGDSCVMMDFDGMGIINRIWLTVSDRSPKMLRSLLFKIYWDGCNVPAVSVPLGDFFCNGAGIMVPFENALFSDPEGRSFNCCIQMPFKQGAKVVLVNQSDQTLSHLFYDINMTQITEWDDDMMYFHSYWNRENPTTLGVDYTILPEVKGTGRFLGVNISVQADSVYENTWWGEGEFKAYIDDDTDNPTLAGTGSEDYIGTAWGQGAYYNMYQGCLVSDSQKRLWTFYRLHIPDPIYFYKNCRVTLQQIGGGTYGDVLKLYEKGVDMKPTTIDHIEELKFYRLLDDMPDLKMDDPQYPHGFTNYYRRDDVTSTAYFYLDRPQGMAGDPSVTKRVAGM